MEYLCENTQHFGWGTKVRLKDPDGKTFTWDITNEKKNEDGFKMPEEGMPYETDTPLNFPDVETHEITKDEMPGQTHGDEKGDVDPVSA